MNIYFFSTHTPEPQMIADLGGSLTAQFKGIITDIHALDDQISFTETLYIGGHTIKAGHTIPAKSIVIIDAPPLQQKNWLETGVPVLLVPKIKQEKGAWGKVVFIYCGLMQVHKIEVITSEWVNPKVADTAGNKSKSQEK